LTREKPGIQELLEVTARLRTTLERICASPIVDPSLSQGLVFGALRRAANVLKAVEAVARLGQPSEVNALGRVICEALYDCAWMVMRDAADRPADEQEAKAQWLVDKATLDGCRILREGVQYGMVPSEAELRQAEERCTEASARQHVSPTQTLRNPNILERAKEAGPPFAENYSLFYRRMCLDAHPTVQANIRALIGEGEDGLGQALFMTMGSARSLAQVCCSVIDREGELADVDSEISRILELFATQ